MGVSEILTLLELAAKAIPVALNAYDEIKDTLSESDAAKIKQALSDAQAATDQIRPLVDSALDAASKS